MGLDGADYVIRGDGFFGTTLDDAIQHDPQVFSAPRNEAHGLDVPMKSAVIDFIAPGDASRGEPIAVFLLDLFAVRVTADGAFSGVALDMRLKLFVFKERPFGGRD
ncbi:MAG TPA: hypothetical protein VJS43_18690 [Candidatus Acidoferrales bacterium]|nr:hypothetical protein [Candidatus Acidoferrales bacterium]